ncbi:PREDICTED: uncharacterized protein LOC107163291 isoform X2 [Diuraphis noxia]|uniref:uncharacterized protein LOC107163291 isoform X2 n=1 Tax=Diuraphis noxia TaxID=143948 RepID=UPI00076386E1|nr:PREDICTED: uncharacterized protein LOC107163291 isoform X2 [Diuraphis noxia]
MEEGDFNFKYISEEDFNKTYKKVSRDRQKQRDDQHWIICMESIKDTDSDSKKTYTIKNDAEVKQSEPSFNKCSNNQFSTHDPVNLYSLHDLFDLKHIHGLRNRLFRTFNEFSSILENALLPPVLKSPKKIQIKIKECDQPNDYIFDLNSLISEIKKESKNEELHKKNNKTTRKFFQIKLIKCYKLAINATKLCSKTLAAGIYNPIQKIEKKYLGIKRYDYGKMYNQKKKESFDLVQKCKDLENMLEECGYKDTDNDNNYSNNIDTNILNELSNKALSKPKHSAYSNRLNMYNEDKPKLGSCYAQKLSKKSVELISNKVLLDNAKTAIEEYPTASKVLSNQLKTTCNVGLYIIKENIWRNFPIKNIRLSQNGAILLNIPPGEAKQHHLYKQQSLKTVHGFKILSKALSTTFTHYPCR